MKTVKVMLEDKNGKEFEALVPITTAVMAMYCGAYDKNGARISRIGYSVVREIHDFCISNARNTEQREQLNNETELFSTLMKREERMTGPSGVELYRD